MASIRRIFLIRAPCSISTLFEHPFNIIGVNRKLLSLNNPLYMDNAAAAAALCLFWRREFRHPRKSAHTKKRITGISISNVPLIGISALWCRGRSRSMAEELLSPHEWVYV